MVWRDVPRGSSAGGAECCSSDRAGKLPPKAVGMIDEQSLAAVACAFETEGEYQSAKPYGNGHIHDTYSATFDDRGRMKQIILQRINTAIFTNPLAVMENIERVTDHLRSRLADEADGYRRVLQLVPARA